MRTDEHRGRVVCIAGAFAKLIFLNVLNQIIKNMISSLPEHQLLLKTTANPLPVFSRTFASEKILEKRPVLPRLTSSLRNEPGGSKHIFQI